MDAILPGVVQGKVWGHTTRIFKSATTRVDRAFARAGWQCSLHHHPGMHNQFFVESGRIRIRTFKDGLEDVTELGPGQLTVVKAGDRHRFEVLEDAWVLEVYWTDLDSFPEIVRQDQGGPITGG